MKRRRVWAYCKHCKKPITKKQNKCLISAGSGWWHEECWDKVEARLFHRG